MAGFAIDSRRRIVLSVLGEVFELVQCGLLGLGKVGVMAGGVLKRFDTLELRHGRREEKRKGWSRGHPERENQRYKRWTYHYASLPNALQRAALALALAECQPIGTIIGVHFLKPFKVIAQYWATSDNSGLRVSEMDNCVLYCVLKGGRIKTQDKL